MSAQQASNAWQLKGACRGPQSTIFFPPPRFERKHERIERELVAREICESCPVTSECLDYALEIREMHGIWGGTNEAERKAMLEVSPGRR